SRPTGAARQRRVAAVALRDLPDDGETEAAAVGAGAQHAVEALEDAPALRGRDAGAVVLDAQEYRRGVRRHAHRDLAAGLRVADRVVEEVVQHFLQQEGIAPDGCARERAVEAEVD